MGCEAQGQWGDAGEAFGEPTQPLFYYPCLTKVASGSNSVEVTDLLGSSDLGLPEKMPLFTVTSGASIEPKVLRRQ